MGRSERAKRDIVCQPEFLEAMLEILGSPQAVERVMAEVEWPLQRDAGLIGIPTPDPSRWAMRHDPWPGTGNPRIIVTYQYDGQTVYCIGADLADDEPELW